MKQSTAWLLDLGEGRRVAVGARELLHLLPEPQLFDVPLAPAHCAQVLSWQDQLLPVWDLRVWLGDPPDAATADLVAIVGYQHQIRQMPFFGAIMLDEPPVRVQVSDEQACALPEERPWADIACSCFTHESRAVPVLDLRSLFSGNTTSAPKP